VVRGAEATGRDGVASAPMDVPDTVARPIALLLPHKTLGTDRQGSLPDLWNGFDGYRDRLLPYLEAIKFGVGLRFYLDPLARHLAMNQDADALVPDSDAFRLEWESYLTKNYSGPDDVKTHWLLTDSFKSIAELARLIPLWSRDRGLPYLFDPANKRVYRVQQSDSLFSYWWTDYQQWRNQSIGYYMNGLADTLKHQVADVPVVYTWTGQETFFAGADPAGGFDGLAVTTGAQDPHRLAQVTGLAYSQAEQSLRAMWLIASEIHPNAPLNSTRVAKPTTPPAISSAVSSPAASPAISNVTATGYNTNREMENDLTDLRRIGIKGLFVHALQPTATATAAEGNWLGVPESLDWLHTFASGLTADAGIANFTPRVLYYPQSVPGPARTTLIPGTSGVYWLPADIAGKPLTWWPTFVGYTMQRGPDQPEETVLISLTGARKTMIFVPDISTVQAHSAEGTPIPLTQMSQLKQFNSLKSLTQLKSLKSLNQVNKNAAEVTIDATPTIFIANGQEIALEAAARDAIDQLGLLEAMAHLDKQTSVNLGQDALADVEFKQAQLYFKQMNFATAYAAARQMIDHLTDIVRPYVWLEGENATGHNFTEVAPNAEASGGGYLRLNTPNPPHYPVPVYAARYSFDIPNDEEYRVWIAGTLPGPETSPIAWYIDRQPEQEPSATTPQGPLYLQDHFGWYQLGTIRLEKGTRNLTIKVTDRAAATNLYSFSIDAILLMPTRREFTPNATIRPIPIDPVTARLFAKTHAPKQQKKNSQQSQQE
jgi:hypothetical protein